jgi:hypothetical protein
MIMRNSKGERRMMGEEVNALDHDRESVWIKHSGKLNELERGGSCSSGIK